MFNHFSIITFCWLVFIIVWLVSALGAKKTIRKTWLQKVMYFRIVLAIVIILILTHTSIFGDRPHGLKNFEYLGSEWGPVSQNSVVLMMGTILCVAGIALAIWARAYLGRNWGMPMSLKENPELVTTGPYAFIRHPIYSGMILAIIGSVMAQGLAWLIPLLVSCVYFFYSAPVEEKIMTKEFPDSYPAYKKRTKMLIPFVF